MAPIVIRKPRVVVRADIPMSALYHAIRDALAAWSPQQAAAFTADAAAATTCGDLRVIAAAYVELIQLPSA
ncbi:MAG: hypothetical protein IPK75_18045 [Acidobacteria bacterium]|nr:hypothetical protein [Acidobacteriota bacterium]